MAKKLVSISREIAKKVGDKLKVDWEKHSLAQFKMGLQVEREHDDVTKGDLLKTGKIALAHLKESKSYYTKLRKMEGKGS